MKNIQVIDGALNAAYAICATTDRDFRLAFPNGQDIEFVEDLRKRLGASEAMRDLPAQDQTVLLARLIHRLTVLARDEDLNSRPTFSFAANEIIHRLSSAIAGRLAGEKTYPIDVLFQIVAEYAANGGFLPALEQQAAEIIKNP